MSTTYPDEPTRMRAGILDTNMSSGTHTHRRISWAAVFGGVLMVVAVQLLLSLLGAGIGLGTINVADNSTPTASSLGIGAGVWWIVSSIIALAFGGYVSAWLAGIELRWDGMLHGLITWSLATLLTVYLLSSAVGGIIGGGASALGSVVSAAGNGIKSAAQPVAEAAGITPETVQQQVQMYLQPTNPDPASMSPQDAQKAIATNLVTYGKGGADAADAKNRIIAIMAAQQKISTEQATQQFNDAQAKLAQAKQQAIQTAKKAADTAATAAEHTAFGAFGTLLIGAIAAAIGGAFAVQRRTTRRLA